ncbi:hypothetical protein NADFUDRAFT_40199 [Nadsonia fulvescens var. elongata DSM 6958]|uniref:Uncharacterized protein n=1 Tax=Nadsonia fulvescens var. elongata DSM 6958 TaxID=857566 RepID=A0A1E3PNL1_9ASCO|nr:hypothetical protein NADFUDRAFT_40199 [Nadsonia fulvescens var. elongata DSM 6958]
MTSKEDQYNENENIENANETGNIHTDFGQVGGIKSAPRIHVEVTSRHGTAIKPGTTSGDLISSHIGVDKNQNSTSANHNSESSTSRPVSRQSLTNLAKFGSRLSRAARGEQSGGDGLSLWQQSSLFPDENRSFFNDCSNSNKQNDYGANTSTQINTFKKGQQLIAQRGRQHSYMTPEEGIGNGYEDGEDEILITSSDEYSDCDEEEEEGLSDDSENGMLFFQPRNIEQQWNKDDEKGHTIYGSGTTGNSYRSSSRGRWRQQLISQHFRQSKLDRQRRQMLRREKIARIQQELNQKNAFSIIKTGLNRLVELARDITTDGLGKDGGDLYLHISRTNHRDHMSPVRQRVLQRDQQNSFWVLDSVLTVYFLTGLFG